MCTSKTKGLKNWELKEMQRITGFQSALGNEQTILVRFVINNTIGRLLVYMLLIFGAGVLSPLGGQVAMPSAIVTHVIKNYQPTPTTLLIG